MFKKIRVETILGLILLVAMGLLATKGIEEAAAAMAASAVANETTQETAAEPEPKVERGSKYIVAVDAGHGGIDPGKIGINGSLEKDINLAIATKLKECLEKEGVQVVMIREDEEGLYDSSVSNKKQDDMRKRCEKIDEATPEFTVSVHQNSYTSESVHGPQVFYYTHSKEGEAISKNIQDALNEQLQIDRPRETKANETYYLLKKTKNPTVIVEASGIIRTNQRIACKYKGFRDLSFFHFYRFSIPDKLM